MKIKRAMHEAGMVKNNKQATSMDTTPIEM
ncbi:hypothetical protein J2T16_005738 [Paenibacillus intestini]|nr:hypothetical protein [Paenibacillus intestini]